MSRRRNRATKAWQDQINLDLQYASTAVSHVMEECEDDFNVIILEDAVNSLELPDCDPSLQYDLKINDTQKKIICNSLHERTIALIQEGAAHSRVIEEFISERAKGTNDPDFPKKLRSFFFREYKRLLANEGLWGDELFEGVRNAVSALIRNPKAKCAALSILVHLFIICDLFERPPENASA